MDFPIYTYGGGDTLIAVFKAIAMLFGAESTYLSPVTKLGFTIGGLYIGVKAIFKGDIGMLTSKWMLPSMFIYMFLFVPKETVWINDKVSMGAPVKIDHVPAGIAIFTSLASQVSHYGATELEEVMLPADAPKAATGGIMYGAKAVAKLRDFRIEDPILLHNTKEYLRQCYMWPYIIGNFGGLKAEAMSTPDILGFLEARPAKCFGIKPIGPDGSVGEFQTCTAAGKDIRAGLNSINKEKVLGKLGAALGIAGANEQMMQKYVRTMTGDTLGYLEQSQREVHEWVKQAMLLNANREAYDDQREQLGISRVYPELVRMQAARGLAQDTLGSIISAEMSDALIPASAQPVMLSIIVISFILILPLSLMPSGWAYIVNGVKAIIWVCSWPLFYTIIAAIGMIQLKHAVGAWGEDGLTLLGQAGFTDLIHLRYAAVQKMISMVPLFSFAVVWGSPYAFSTMAGAITGASAGAAIGSAAADGNMNMNQVSVNNTTRDQHNEAPTLKMGGGVVDDGAMSVMMDSSGNEIVTQYQDQMTTNYKTTDSLSASTGISLSNAQSDLASNSKRYTEQESIANTQSTDFAKRIASGTTTSESISDTDMQTLKDSFSISSSTQETDSVSNSKTTGTSSSLGLSTPGAVTAVTGISGSTSTHASNVEDIRKDMSTQERQAFDAAMENVKQVARTGNFQTSSSEDRTLGESLGTNLTKLDQIAEERARSQQTVDTLTDQMQYLESNAATIDRNVNNAVIEEIMHAHPELRTKSAAVRYINSHKDEADGIAAHMAEKYNPFKNDSTAQRIEQLNKNTPNIKNTEIPPVGSLKGQYEKDAQKVQQHAAVKDATGAEKPMNKVVESNLNDSKMRYNKSNEEIIEDKIIADPNAQDNLETLTNERDRGKGSEASRIQKKLKKADDKYESLAGKSTVVRVATDIGDTAKTVVDKVTGNEKEKGD